MTFRFKRLAGALALAVCTTGLTAAVATPAFASAKVHGCPSGAVCVYPRNAGWNGGHPERGGVYFSYGAHNLHDQLGYHYVLNNQYIDNRSGWPMVSLMTGYNGSGKASDVLDPVDGIGLRKNGSWVNFNLTPINSLYLWDR